MVQEVLEQIKAAEDAVEEHRQQAKMNCRLYEEQKQERLAETKRTEQALHERYEANKEQVIDSIIERVKDVYGS